MSDLETLVTPNYLTHFLAVLIAFAGLFILMSKVVEAIRVFKKPKEKHDSTLTNHQENCDRKFANDKRMLDDHDKRIINLEEGQRVQCAALHALLEHAIHNGNTAEMKTASDDLFNYLNGNNR